MLVLAFSRATYMKKNALVTKLMYFYHTKNSWCTTSPLPTTAEIKIYLHLSQFLPIYSNWSHNTLIHLATVILLKLPF